MESHSRWITITFVLAGAGTANVILMKYTDIHKGECRDGKYRNFQHPLVQTLFMFLGQMLCYLIYKTTYWFRQSRQERFIQTEATNDIEILEIYLPALLHHEIGLLLSVSHIFIYAIYLGRQDGLAWIVDNDNGGREFSKFAFILPAFLDTIASILLFTGLYLTYATSFQMLRSAAIIFIGIFNTIHLNQTLIMRHWIAMFTIVVGLTIIISMDVQRVAYDNAGLPHSDANAILTGDLLILCAQVFHAAQIVYEDKYLKYNDVPEMEATGLQGIFGTIMCAILLYFIPTSLPFIDNSRGVCDNLSDVLWQLSSNAWITVALCIFVITSALYNYTALCIVKYSSGANLIIADVLREMMIWIIAQVNFWEQPFFVTVLGFIILKIGIFAHRTAISIEYYLD